MMDTHRVSGRLGRGVVAVLAAAALASWLQFAAVTIPRELLGAFSWKWWLRDQLLLTGTGCLLVFAILGMPLLLAHVLWPRNVSFGALAGIGRPSLRPLLAGMPSQATASPVLAELTAHDQDSERASRVPASLAALVDDASHMMASDAGALRVLAIPADTAQVEAGSGDRSAREPALERHRRVLDSHGIPRPEGGAGCGR